MERSLLLVVGPGRSGTSSMAGALSASGFTAPGASEGNRTNPKGFFEPRWMVDLHKELLRRSGMIALDPDPEGLELASVPSSRTAVRAEVREWLAARFEESPRLVLKDPRLIWFLDLWTQTARDLGVEPTSVFMLRHPAEVTASRSTYYDARDVAAVAGWINVATLTERSTRTSRSIVHYPDLLADWRSQFTRIGRDAGIAFDPAIEVSPHPVDDLLDPALRRMSPDWDAVAAPFWLRDLAERSYQALLAESRGEQVDPALFDALRGEYLESWHAALGMTNIERRRLTRQAERRGARRARTAVPEPADGGLRTRAASAARRLLGR
ncbi:sulfotransferase family protein [Nocardioides sp. Bht2]|uniref:sulfotransferase family protein n=1 Tax=Nocardioides sp. Bht2 TaxID=3392297 RepID=UPI0039B4E2D9